MANDSLVERVETMAFRAFPACPALETIGGMDGTDYIMEKRALDLFPQTVRSKNTVILSWFSSGPVPANGETTFFRKREHIRHPFSPLVPC
jgi:hypothetical protein